MAAKMSRSANTRPLIVFAALSIQFASLQQALQAHVPSFIVHSDFCLGTPESDSGEVLPTNAEEIGQIGFCFGIVRWVLFKSDRAASVCRKVSEPVDARPERIEGWCHQLWLPFPLTLHCGKHWMRRCQ